jgi:hypothetical protein
MSTRAKPRYFPATTIPPTLLREVQDHCDGGYLYIPRRQGYRLVDRILRWAARGETPGQIAVLARCSRSYVYKVLAAHPDGLVAVAAEGAGDENATIRAPEQTERQRRRRIAQLQRQVRAGRGEGRAAAMQGNQHATRHGVYSQRFTPDEQALMAELRPHLVETHPADDAETLLRTLIQLQRALAIAHGDAIERLDRRLRRLLRPELAQRRRPRADAPAVAPLDWLTEFLRLRTPPAAPLSPPATDGVV